MRFRFGVDFEIHRDRHEPEHEQDAPEDAPKVDQKASHILDRRSEMDMSSTPMGFCAAPSKGAK